MKKTFFSLALAAFLCGGISICAAEKGASGTEKSEKIAVPEKAKKISESVPAANFRWEKADVSGFEIFRRGNEIVVKAASKVNFKAGVGYFQKHFQKIHRSWNGDRLRPLVPAETFSGTIKIPEQWRFRYAYNYCTLSYSCAFWGEDEWEAELEKMALNGVTHALVQAGLEKVWFLTLRELGYPKEKIAAFIPDVAAAAWWNMGNLEGLGAPISQNQIEREAKLGKFIVDCMAKNGIKPVLQGFVGLVPHDFENVVPEKTKKALGQMRIISQGEWVDKFVRESVLDPTCPAFPRFAKIWYKNLEKVYGIKAEAFAGDLFHEGGKSAGINVPAAAKAVQNEMLSASPNAIWVLQHWGKNPSNELLSGLNKEKALVLSLTRNMKNGNDGAARRTFAGTPWAWCELLNFGGNHGLYGSLKILANLGEMQNSRERETLVGIGMLSEGTQTNPMFYDLFFDRFWMKKTENMSSKALEKWISDYALRRYGKNSADAVAALKLLERSVYSPTREQEGCTESIFCARPERGVKKASTWARGEVYYNPADVREALEKMISAAEKNPEILKTSTFRYDLIDVARQFLSDIARPLLEETMKNFDAKNAAKFAQNSKIFLEAISATDEILATHRLWRFGEMFELAQKKGTNAAEKKANEIALKRLVTTWTGRAGTLNDYSHRQLSGLMKDFYLKRWTIFFDAYSSALKSGNPAKIKALPATFEKFETSFATGTTKYSAAPKGDSLAEAKKILAKFGPISRKYFAAGTPMQESGEAWTLREGARELVFDVSGDVVDAGKYSAEFRWKSGNHAIKIVAVHLFNGNEIVAEDVHEGFSGVENSKNIYRLNLKKMRDGLGSYTLKAEVSGVGGNESDGILIFKKE